MKYKASLTKQVVEIMTLMVREQTPMGVSRIAERLSLNKSTAFGILSALVQQGYVVKDDHTKRYAMGKQLYAFVNMIAQRGDLIVIAQSRWSTDVRRSAEFSSPVR